MDGGTNTDIINDENLGAGNGRQACTRGGWHKVVSLALLAPLAQSVVADKQSDNTMFHPTGRLGDQVEWAHANDIK